MRKIREVLRLRHQEGLSNRQISGSVSLPLTTVRRCLKRARAAGLGWPLPEELDDRELEVRLFPPPPPSPTGARRVPDWKDVHRELRRKGVTLQLLWMEYKEWAPDGYQYTQFCHHYRQWTSRLDVVLRQEHRFGEKLFVDYAGPTLPITDARTGAVTPAPLFVGVLGASNYTYAEARASQTMPDWIGCHVNAFEYIGAVTEIIVPDYVPCHIIGHHDAEDAPKEFPGLLETFDHLSQRLTVRWASRTGAGSRRQ